MAEKVTVMVLKVDLQCTSCYKKVKKILHKFPQIRDQAYNEEANMVTITVVCCDPKKIRDKLCCKGANVIKSIEIKEPPKEDEPEEGEPALPLEEKPEVVTEPALPPEEKPEVVTEPAPFAYPPGFPVRTCCGGYYGGCLCYHGYGHPQLCYCDCGSYVSGYGHAHRFGYYYCCTEENPQYCSIM